MKRRLVGLALNLQMFGRPMLMDGDGGAAGGGAGAGAGDGGAAGGGGGAGADGGNSGGGSGGQGGGAGGGGAQPFAVFPDEASFMSRVKREAKAQYGEFLKGLGFEKEDDLKGIITAHNENVAKSKTDLDKANEARATAEKTATDALALVNKTLIGSEAKVKALALGVKPERVDYALRLADLTAVTVVDNVVNAEALTASIQKVLTDMPELKGTVVPGQGGGDFGGGNGGAGALTWQAIESMPQAEVEQRMPEIMAFMEKNPRR